MKKIFKLILVISLIASNFISFEKVEAADYYPMACDAYEVSYIEDDGTLKKVECYDNFKDANKKMKELGGDHVVRHPNSYSPTKIIAMNSGYAYAYPGRGGSATLNIYEDVYDRSIYTKRTYISHYYQMQYYETTLVLASGGIGMIHVNMNGFDGYTDLEYTDLVPSKYIEKGIAIWLGGKNTYFNESPYRIILERDYYTVKQNGSYNDLMFTYHLAYPKTNSLQCITYNLAVGAAPDFMKSGTSYYSEDGIHFYSDPSLKTGAGTYFNYYQWLPMRSKTKITAAEIESYLKEALSSRSLSKSALTSNAQAFIDGQNKYGVNALLLFAMACHESYFGTSNYALKRNNLFGWNAYDASPGSASYFSDIKTSVYEQMGINLRGYMDIYDGRFFGLSLGNKGAGFNVKYASDPYWGMKIAAIAYDCDKASKHYNGSLTDYDTYEMIIIDIFDAEFKAEPNSKSTTYFTSAYGDSYQKYFITIKLGESGEYTKVQSPNAIDDSGNVITHRTPAGGGTLNAITTYDYNTSVAYIKTSDLKSLTASTTTNSSKSTSSIVSVSSLNFKDGKLNLGGIGLIEGVDFSNKDNVKQELTIYSLDNDDSNTYTISTVSADGFSLNDGVNYAYGAYKGEIDLSKLANGRYALKLKTTNGNSVGETVIKSANESYTDLSFTLGDKTYVLRANEIYDYRLEIEIRDTALDYSKVNKPSSRNSLSTYDSISIDDNLNLTLKGHSIIYYLNYAGAETSTYNLYLIKGSSITNTSTSVNACELSYSDLFSSEYNYDYVCYSSKVSLADLDVGTYELFLDVSNGEYYDINAVHNASLISLANKSKDGKKYELLTDENSERIYLKISK